VLSTNCRAAVALAPKGAGWARIAGRRNVNVADPGKKSDLGESTAFTASSVGVGAVTTEAIVACARRRRRQTEALAAILGFGSFSTIGLHRPIRALEHAGFVGAIERIDRIADVLAGMHVISLRKATQPWTEDFADRWVGATVSPVIPWGFFPVFHRRLDDPVVLPVDPSVSSTC